MTADVAESLRATLRQAAAHERLVLLCSFQKEESVILDELVAIAPHARVVTIDTGVLFDQTLATWRAFEERFGVRIEVQEAFGAPPWSGPEHCCGTAKVAALERALEAADAWITGLRREQGPTRAATEPVETDARRGIAKYNPLALWTERDLWQRIHERGLPYHPLHDEGYASIGCAPCTLPGSGRDGRWVGLDKTECGLHVSRGQAMSPANNLASSDGALSSRGQAMSPANNLATSDGALSSRGQAMSPANNLATSNGALSSRETAQT